MPEGTASLALFMEDIFFSDDPYGPVYHWVIFNIPADAGSLPEGVPAGDTLADGSMQAQNFAAEVVYAGPYPPPDEVHEYTFTLYALDTTLDVPGGAPGEDVVAAMEGHILATAEITGWYLGFTP
jgi:Raf kinase inhibitor-like YbhB/YbcL family protein